MAPEQLILQGKHKLQSNVSWKPNFNLNSTYRKYISNSPNVAEKVRVPSEIHPWEFSYNVTHSTLHNMRWPSCSSNCLCELITSSLSRFVYSTTVTKVTGNQLMWNTSLRNFFLSHFNYSLSFLVTVIKSNSKRSEQSICHNEHWCPLVKETLKTFKRQALDKKVRILL